MRNKEAKSRELAKTLRRKMTNAEVILWSRLRESAIGGLRFRRQHPIGQYIADFACVQRRLVLEIDGATHSSDRQIESDQDRTRYLERLGWQILRIQNDDIYRRLDDVLAAVLSYAPTPAFGRTSPASGGGKKRDI